MSVAYNIVERIYKSARDRSLFDGIDDVVLTEIVEDWWRQVVVALVGPLSPPKPPHNLLAHLRNEVV